MMTEQSGIPEPTPEDLARDAAADLAVCEANGEPFDELVYTFRSTVDFATLARTALPAWIRRAEAEHKERESIERARDYWYGVADAWEESYGCIVQELDEMRTRLEKAEAEVARLCAALEESDAADEHLKRIMGE